MKIETIGTIKIPEERGRERKESLWETCIFRGFEDDKDPEQSFKTTISSSAQRLNRLGLRKGNWDREVIGIGQLSKRSSEGTLEGPGDSTKWPILMVNGEQ